ncbi:hypothetical protein SAMN03159444_03551 [Pseudomonas sp. NFACC02]|nr:hypothetical protein SAMN03159444_03551 [Pseudomonas sp. NFACC02]
MASRVRPSAAQTLVTSDCSYRERGVPKTWDDADTVGASLLANAVGHRPPTRNALNLL